MVEDEGLTIRGAALCLGISEGAVRKRITRGQLRSDMGSDGRRRVYVPESTPKPEVEGSGEMVEELRDRVRFLERSLEAEQEGRRRADTIIAQLSQATAEQARTIRELEAPKEQPEASQQGQDISQEHSEGDVGVVEDRGEPEKRSWWRRVLSG